MKGLGIFKLIIAIFLVGVLGYIAVTDITYTTIDEQTGDEVTKSLGLNAGNIDLGLDLQGGVSIVYQPDLEEVTAEDLNSAVALIRGRLDRDGHTDAEVAISGTDKIAVDIPGVEDADKAIKDIGAAAQLSFVDVDGNVYLTGSDVTNASARQQKDSNGFLQTVVVLEFSDEGREKFADATEATIGSYLIIMLDDEVLSTPGVDERIYSSSAQISGNFTIDEAKELADLINSGALPFRLNVISDNIVGAKLGADAIKTSITAGLIGISLVILFMIFAYRLFGAISSIALTLFISLEIIALNLLEVTLTLPGIAGIILSIGMAVDANIIIFERIKEEIKENKSLRVAVKSGFSRAFPAILDGNITTLLAAFILYTLGNGPIKGFAQTLSIGIILSMFTALVVTRGFISIFIKSGLRNPKFFGSVLKESKTLKLVSNRKRYFSVSAVLIVGLLSIGIANFVAGNDVFNYDIEFSGGTAFTLDMGQEFDNEELRGIIEESTGESNIQIQKIVGTNEVSVKMKEIDQDTRIEMISSVLTHYDLTEESIIDISSISGTISQEMRNSAILAVSLSTLIILLYVSIRFSDLKTGLSAVFALVHDALLVVVFYMAFRIPLNYSFIAVMLTVIGYSINSTIVIFDRVRENKKAIELTGNEPNPKDLINISVSQTLNRSLFTSVTTLITVVVLYILGVSTIREFALPIIFGVVVGTYSSVFISGNIWYTFTKMEFFKKFESEPEVKKITPKRYQ